MKESNLWIFTQICVNIKKDRKDVAGKKMIDPNMGKCIFQDEAILDELYSWEQRACSSGYCAITERYAVSRAQSWAVSWSTPWGLGWAELLLTVPAGPLLCEVILRKGRARLQGGSRASNGMLTRSLNVLHPLSRCPLCFNYTRAPDKSTHSVNNCCWRKVARHGLVLSLGPTWNICLTKGEVEKN